MEKNTKNKVENPDTQVCPLCAGTRVVPSRRFMKGKPCPQCDGYGELQITEETIYPVKAFKS